MRFNFKDNFEFEAFVRKLARECWGATGYSGPITVDGKERDGVLENDLQIFCLEITVAKSAKHTADACRKLDGLVRRLRGRHPDKGVTGWYITRDEPTGEQGAIINQYKTIIHHQTYDAFYAKIVDAKQYLFEREKKPFGSIRGPEDGRFDATLKYTPTKIFEPKSGNYTHTASLEKALSKGSLRLLLVGEYGAGKSMALRDIFRRLSLRYRSGGDSQFPVYINLREHIEQHDPDECLRRHASSVGLSKPERLVSAWRSGLVYLLLDGFDELAPRVATGSHRRAQDLRNSAITLVKRLVEETPLAGSILLAGRNNYFDTDHELHSAVGVDANWKLLELHDLDDEDLARFISDHGWQGGLPDWVPKKPLLIAYVKQQRLADFEEAEGDFTDSDPARGWDFLIDRICEREVSQVYVALDASELRRIFGRLATFARRRQDKRGPLSFSDSRQAFIEITGVEPEERSITAILRLPGLSGSLSGVEASGLERGSRFFVDGDFADALGAEDVARAIALPYEYSPAVHEGIMHPLSELGGALAYIRLGDSADTQLGAALRHFCANASGAVNGVLADIVGIVFQSGARVTQECFITNIYIPSLRVEGGADWSNFTFDCCAFEQLKFDFVDAPYVPNFQNCQIEKMFAPESVSEDLSAKLSEFSSVDSILPLSTSFESLRADGAPEMFLDLASVIDKVFIQSQRGRQVSALFRGRPNERRAHISAIIDRMRRGGWISISKRGGVEIAVPNLSRAAEAKRIIARKEVTHEFAASLE